MTMIPANETPIATQSMKEIISFNQHAEMRAVNMGFVQ
jgi:hypothetical protein